MADQTPTEGWRTEPTSPREPGAGSRYSRLISAARRAATVFAMLILVGIGAWLATRYDLSISLEPVAVAGAATGGSYQPAYQRIEGPQLVLLFVGSSTCSASADPALPDLIERLKLRVAEYADRNGLTFWASAIAADWLPAQGLRFLEPFGSFDEVTVGGNWMGHGLVRQTWDHGLQPATPGVYILKRELVVEEGSLHLARLGLDDEHLLIHRQGVPDLRALAELPVERYLDARLGETTSGSEL
jgi:hypothetical protein